MFKRKASVLSWNVPDFVKIYIKEKKTPATKLKINKTNKENKTIIIKNPFKYIRPRLPLILGLTDKKMENFITWHLVSISFTI